MAEKQDSAGVARWTIPERHDNPEPPDRWRDVFPTAPGEALLPLYAADDAVEELLRDLRDLDPELCEDLARELHALLNFAMHLAARHPERFTGQAAEPAT